MGAHTSTPSSTGPSAGGLAAAATGLTVLGLLGGAGAAFAGDAPGASGGSEDSSEQCSVGGTPDGGSGTGSPDGVITNGQCSPEEIEQAQHRAATDGDPSTRPDSHSGHDDADSVGGDPTVVGGTGDGVSSQEGTSQKVAGPSDDQPIAAGVL